MRNKRTFLTIAVIVVAVAASFLVSNRNNNQKSSQSTAVAKPTACLKVSTASTSCDYNLDQATNALDRAQGLSGRDGLAPKTGMLFVFEKPEQACMWMKGMKFNLDILWLDKDKKIKRIEPDLSPSTYTTDSNSTTYCSQDTAYVVELNTGEAKAHNLTLGQQLIF